MRASVPRCLPRVVTQTLVCDEAVPGIRRPSFDHVSRFSRYTLRYFSQHSKASAHTASIMTSSDVRPQAPQLCCESHGPRLGRTKSEVLGNDFHRSPRTQMGAMEMKFPDCNRIQQLVVLSAARTEWPLFLPARLQQSPVE